MKDIWKGSIRMNETECINKMLRVYKSANAGTELVCNQGQALDGFSELANYRGILKNYLQTNNNEHTKTITDAKGNIILGQDHALNFALMIAHGGFLHKKWLIKAALNYSEGKDIHFENNNTPDCP